jgi:hypothetical protein
MGSIFFGILTRENIATHDVIRNVFVSIANDVGFHVSHVFQSPSF